MLATPDADKKYATEHAEIETKTEVLAIDDQPHDVWGDIEGGGPNYRGLGWIRASVILMKIQVGLGVLAIPFVLSSLGLVPGLLVIVGGAGFLTWSDYVIGLFKIHHPEAYSLADAGFIMWGPIGREIMGAAYYIFLTFGAGAGLVGISTAFNAITDHGTCTVVFVLVAAVINIAISCIQTLEKLSWMGWVGLIAIMASIVTLAAAVGVQDRPAAAPQTGPWSPNVKAFGSPNFSEGMTAVATVVFSYAGTTNFMNVAAEMKEPKKYFWSMYTCQFSITVVYIVIGSVVYHFCGDDVASPALGSAGVLMKKVCYGLALPGLIVGTVFNTHLPAKYVFVRILRDSKHLTKNTITHRIVWGTCVVVNCTFSFIVAESIPIFGDLISLVGALLACPLCMTFEGLMYIWEFRHQKWPMTWKAYLIHAYNGAMIAISIFLMVAGTYASIVEIKTHIESGKTSTPWSCADNSK